MLVVFAILMLVLVIANRVKQENIVSRELKEQISVHESARNTARVKLVIDGIMIFISLILFLFTETKHMVHHDGFLIFAATDVEELNDRGYTAWILLIIGSLLFVINGIRFTNNDIKMLEYQNMSESDYLQLRIETAQKIKEEDEQDEKRMKRKFAFSIARLFFGI